MESIINLADLLLPDWANHKLPDPELYQLWQGFQNREVWLEDAICWETVGLMYKYIQRAGKEESREPITVYIMSPGGDLDVMFALYHLFKTSPVPVHTVNIGRCHSAAFVIFLAGKTRTMSPYATFIAHEGSGVVGGSFRETKAAMAQYERDVEKMCRIVESETDLDYDYIKKRFSEESDWYIGYDEALEAKIIRE